MASALATALVAMPTHALDLFEDISAAAGLTYIGETYGASWGDFNSDGLPDLWVGNHFEYPSLLINQGNATFVNVIEQVWPGRNRADTHGAAWADFDNDGDQDLLEVVGSGQPSHLLINAGGMLLERAAEFGLAYPGMRARTPTWLDWNQDGKLDLTVAHELGNGTYPSIMENFGSMFLDRSTLTGLPATSQMGALLADFTGDGVSEVLYTNGNRNNGPIYNTASLPFQALAGSAGFAQYPSRVGCADTVIADFDGDARADIFATCGGGGREVVQPAPNEIEMRISSAANEVAVEFVGGGRITLTIWPSFSFAPATHLRAGSGGFVPASVARPDLGWLAVSVTLDPADTRFWGTPPHTPGASLGLFVGFEPASNKWKLALSAPGSAILSMTAVGETAMTNLSSLGFALSPPPSLPSMVMRTADGFIDRTLASGLNLPLPCPSAIGGDFDNDMDVDLYLECSRPISNLENMLFLNNGAGVFSAVAQGGGAPGSTQGSGDVVAAADFDLDGFLDLFVTNGAGSKPFNNGPHQLYRNRGNANRWLEIDLVGVSSNRDAIGASVRVVAGGKTQLRFQDNGMHVKAQNFKRLHFGLGSHRLVDELKVTWPGGQNSTFARVPTNRVIRILESGNPDTDDDGAVDFADNCPSVANGEQLDTDGDLLGDACDDDDDGDGMSDAFESAHGFDPVDATDAAGDADADGLSNAREAEIGTHPRQSDSDSDGIDDGHEDTAGSDPRSANSVPTVYETGVIRVGSSAWTTVNLARRYRSMVVIGTVDMRPQDPPLVVRMRGASADRFEVRVQRADNSSVQVVDASVHYLVVEEGVYNVAQHGIRMEASTFQSSVIDHAASWAGERRSYRQPYVNPVVLGQVMSYNDARFSVFWSHGAGYYDPPSAQSLFVGRHVGEDPVRTRAVETIGYVVIEAGAGFSGWRAWNAGVGSDTVAGFGDAPPYRYSLLTADPTAVAIVSAAGMDGPNGGWPVLYAENTLPDAELTLAFDEDNVFDSERSHTTEQVGYVSFGPLNHSAPSLEIVGPERVVIRRGHSARLEWRAARAHFVRVSPAPAVNLPLLGTLDVAPTATTTYTISAIGPNGVTTRTVEVAVESGVPHVVGSVVARSDTWTTVQLARAFTSMVDVTTPNYDAATPPLAVRIRNAVANSFELRLERMDNLIAPAVSARVHYLVVEAGIYSAAEHGVAMEAVTLQSTVVDHAASWIGEQRLYANNYTVPVVLGQVMTANDARASVFWSRGRNVSTAPDPTSLWVGRHVGEDLIRSRQPETIGYIVVEAGLANWGAGNVLAGRGTDTVAGMGDAPPYVYPRSTVANASIALAGLSSMDGPNGGWAVLHGPSPLAPGVLLLAVDEDNYLDTERAHTTEKIGFLLFE